RVGVYVVRRSQIDRDGYGLSAWVIDGHLRWVGAVGPLAFHVEGEVARSVGETDTVRDIYTDSTHIDQLGAAGELGLGLGDLTGDPDAARHVADLIVQAGYASGDDRPVGGRLTASKFDPEDNVGLALIDQVP